MPMVELEVGGASQRAASEPAAAREYSGPSARASRATRCLAAFYDDPADAQAVADALRRQFGLQAGQVAVIAPGNALRRDFQNAARSWQAQRHGPGADSLNRLTLGCAGAGIAVASMLAVPVWLAAGGAHGEAGSGLWLLAGPLAGAVAGAVAAGWLHARQPGQRFDETVRRKLDQGFSAVVTHGLGPTLRGQVLACLQGNSHSWCAEAARHDQRL